MAKLSRQQLEAYKVIVARQLRFQSRAVDRLARLGYTPADPLFRAAIRARDVLQELHMAIHYDTVGHGVWRP